jgi:hypothetical protein
MKSSKPPLPEKIPFKPRKNLFFCLLVIYAIWLGALLAMYFATHCP